MLEPHLPLCAVLQSVAYLILGLKQDVLELRRAGPADGQLVVKVANKVHLHIGGRVCSYCRTSVKMYETCLARIQDMNIGLNDLQR